MGKRIEIPYEGLLNIPEQTVGDFQIKHIIHPAGKPIDVSNARTRMYGGHGGRPLVYDHETRWHELLENGGRWTTDLPIEQFQQRASLKGFRGNVLIGGLGLGVVVQMLTKYKNVSRIDVVEKSLEVCQLVQPFVGDQRTRFYRTDLFDHLRNLQGCGQIYDHAFFDIWTSDSEGEFYGTVLPLRKLARPIVKRKITCWNEDIMRGQVAHSLFSPLELHGLFGPKVKEMNVPSLEWFAGEGNESAWHLRTSEFYRLLLEKKVDLTDPLTRKTCEMMAYKWAYRYDGTDEWVQRWVKYFADEWDFSKMYCSQLLEEQAKKRA